MYNKSYSQTGYSQFQSQVLFASASSNFEITSNLKSLNFLFESFQTSQYLQSNLKSTSILDISFFSSMFLNSNFTEMNLALFRGQTNFKFNSNYNNLNTTFEKYDSNFKLVSNFTDSKLVLEKFQTLQNLNSQVNARHFSIISSLHYSIERLNSNYKIMIPGRLIFRGKVWSQSPDDPIY